MDWLTISLEQFWGILLSSLGIYIALMVIVKLNGLRSFSKMSPHDFAITVAIGSIVATVIVADEPSILQGAVGIGSLLFLQALFSKWRIVRDAVYTENEPLLLMRGTDILHDNLKKADITEADLIAKLREANVIQLSQVKAVVLEATGDVSVLHDDGEEQIELEDFLLKNVRES